MKIGPLTIGWGSRRRQGQRAYAAAAANRFTADWIFGNQSANEEVKAGLQTIRERARQLERDNPYVRRYLALCEQNIIGRGVLFSSKVYSPGMDGKPDDAANYELETAWRDWGARYASALAGQTWVDIQKLAVRCWKRDGEAFVRIMRSARTPYKFALQILEADHCDHQYNLLVSSGRRVVMGVEIDSETDTPVAYHFLTQHPGERNTNPTERVRIPASEIIHLFRPERPGQVRGVSSMAGVMIPLNMLNGYEEAALTAARAAACKMAFYVIPPGEDFQGETKDDKGPLDETSPGQMPKLPYGWDIKTIDWHNPNSEYAPFSKAQLRKIANGLGVSYNNFANDLEGVNFSSLRGGTIEERDAWTGEQDFFIAHFCRVVYAAWLDMYLLSGKATLPYSRYDELLADSWQGRRWQWVDPEKDIAAARAAYELRVKALSEVIAEQGGDPDETWSQIEKDKATMEDYGLTSAATGAAPAADATGAAPAVQDTALNGAQIASLVEILKEAAAGNIPLAAVQPMLTAAFPTVDAGMVSQIAGSLKGFTPAVAEPTPKEPTNADT